MAEHFTGNSHRDDAREELAAFVEEVRDGLTAVSRTVERLRNEVERLSARLATTDTARPSGDAWQETPAPVRPSPAVPSIIEQPSPLHGLAEGSWPVPRAAASVAAEEEEPEPEASADEPPVPAVEDELPAYDEESTESPPDDAPEAPPEDADPAAVREQVRLEVERARAAIAAGRLDVFEELSREDDADERSWQAPAAETPPAEASREPAPAAAPLAYAPEREDRPIIINPVVVVDDESGRVELVRVYEALSSVGYAGEASLINYTPHTVKVGLTGTTMPDTGALGEAIEKAFGRACEVAVDGNRITVSLRDRRSHAA